MQERGMQEALNAMFVKGITVIRLQGKEKPEVKSFKTPEKGSFLELGTWMNKRLVLVHAYDETTGQGSVRLDVITRNRKGKERTRIYYPVRQFDPIDIRSIPEKLFSPDVLAVRWYVE